MSLIIIIALGIIAAVVIMNFWQEILALAALVIAVAAVAIFAAIVFN